MKGTEDATTDRSGPVPVVAISARFVVGVALIGVAMVNIANGLAVAFRPWEDSDRVGVETAEWLLLVSENNPSTWLASILLALGACISLMVARVGPRSQRIGWYGVAGFLALLSLDEAASIHERLGVLFGSDGGGGLTYAWVLPGAALLAVVMVPFTGFLRRLDATLRRQLVSATAVFLSGGLVVEAIAGWWDGREGSDNIAYHLISAVEENLELLGAVLWIAALLGYLVREIVSVELRFRSRGVDVDQPSG